MDFPHPPTAPGGRSDRRRPLSPWEVALREVTGNPRPGGSRPPLTFVLPASAQIPTPNREFLLSTPSEGVSYVATLAENMGWDVELVDMRLGVSAETAAARAVSRGGVLAMPTFADSYAHNRRVLELVKEQSPEMPAILGGTLVSSMPVPLMGALPADYAVLREGELTTLELLEHLERGGSRQGAAGIEGLAVRFPDGRVHLTRHRSQIDDLDAVPIPDLFLYPSTKEDPRIPELGLTTARGCYARCTFCYVNFPKMRFKSVPRVREELWDLKRKHQVEYIYINDLTFTSDLERARELCAVLGETGITWSCSTRVEKASPDLLKEMHDSGCRDIWYGVESVDQRVLDLANKRQTVAQIREAIQRTMAAGIKVMTNFIIGLPGESKESLEAMVRFVEEEVVTPASVKYLSPFPGTPIYDDAIRRGVIRDPIDYLEHLARRRVNDEADEIFNMTDLPDSMLRDAFRRLDGLRRSRVAEHFREPRQAAFGSELAAHESGKAASPTLKRAV